MSSRGSPSSRRTWARKGGTFEDLDHGAIDERIQFGNDSPPLPLAGILRFPVDELQRAGMQVIGRDRESLPLVTAGVARQQIEECRCIGAVFLPAGEQAD